MAECLRMLSWHSIHEHTNARIVQCISRLGDAAYIWWNPESNFSLSARPPLWVATKEPSWQLSPENPIVETELNFAFATGRAGVFLQLASFAFPHIWFICQISKLNCFDTCHNSNGTNISMWRVWFPYESKQSKSRLGFFGNIIVFNGLLNILTKTAFKMRLDWKWTRNEYWHTSKDIPCQAPKAYFLTMMGIYAFR